MATQNPYMKILNFFKFIPLKNENYSQKQFRVFDTEFHFYSEGYFHQLHSLEQKRSQRSNNPFLLVTVNIDKLITMFKSKELGKRINKILDNATRDIDIKGWYKKHEIIGIIYSEYKDETKDLILHKINDQFHKEFGKEMVPSISFTNQIYPKKPSLEETDSIDPGFLIFPFFNNPGSVKSESRFAYEESMK